MKKHDTPSRERAERRVIDTAMRDHMRLVRMERQRSCRPPEAALACLRSARQDPAGEEMKHSEHPATSKRSRAAVYRKAAKIIEKEQCGLACMVVHHLTGRTNYFDGDAPMVKAFAAVMEPGHGDERGFPGWWGYNSEPENHCARILGLCFMAAMVETGDA